MRTPRILVLEGYRQVENLLIELFCRNQVIDEQGDGADPAGPGAQVRAPFLKDYRG
jgi:hypothetical protein